MSILQFNAEMSDEDLTRAGWGPPDSYQRFNDQEADELEVDGTALVLLKGPISNLDGARLVTTSS
jgi:hypothetical protein